MSKESCGEDYISGENSDDDGGALDEKDIDDDDVSIINEDVDT